jgi:hypothetical protein
MDTRRKLLPGCSYWRGKYPDSDRYARSISSPGKGDYLFRRVTQPGFIRDLRILIVEFLIGLSRLHGPLNKIKETLAASA